ncbi:hypothetical protein S83_061862 [Arachis hypogaea]|uniref:BHLH domain-containing protein n=2 Tax=Arachis TaxID=3817 RepID=A0A444Y6Q5_ARAHY|nr:hypothetical protein Ahy_B08g093698 [Arachis hypogaea]
MEPYSIDPMFSGMSLQSLLNLNPSLLSFLTDHPPQPQLPNHLTLHPTLEPYFNFIPKRPRLTYSSCSSSSSSPPSSLRAKPLPPKSNFARQRRQKLSEKTRCLQKLMPWDKKMDQATLFEQAYSYVKFLQAQVSVLQSMPYHAPPSPSFNNGGGCVFGFGDLERLNRNQLLQVLVNSPVAQTVMSSKGLCVFSMEQLGLLTKLSERRLLLQNMNANMNMVSDSKPFFN